jgi:type IV pilus assembly protein PilB
MVDEESLARALAAQHGLEYLNLGAAPPNPTAVRLLPERYATEHRALPVKFLSGGSILVALADPTDVVALDVIKLATGSAVELAVATSSDIDACIAGVHGDGDDDPNGTQVETEAGGVTKPELADVRESADSAPAVGLVNKALKRAIEQHASDIHFEPEEDQLVVRARIDGMARRMDSAPTHVMQAIAARLKIMGDLDIAERRAPQDGRTTISFGGSPIDLRIAVLPTSHGEQVVIRILYRSSGVRELSDLGMSAEVAETFESALRQPYGAVHVCGPTGSGKTATLYAGLAMLNTEDDVLMTIEDPVEYQVEGIMQIDVNARAGLTFTTGLRTILRSDPDVLLVGEIRDGETAGIAVQATVTGHLVLSTIHANTATRAVSRLRNMGVEAELIVNTVNTIIAQRLARVLCPNCKEERESPGARFLYDDGPNIDIPPSKVYSPKGCAQCGRSSYTGRVAFYEILDLFGELRASVDAPTAQLETEAFARGRKRIAHDGLRLVLEGRTALEEIARITGGRVEELPVPSFVSEPPRRTDDAENGTAPEPSTASAEPEPSAESVSED